MSQDKKDPLHCGIGGLETGDWDPYHKPACADHDESMIKQKEGVVEEMPIDYTGRFLKNTTITAVKGLYAVVTFPLYFVFGGLGGLILGNSRLRKKDVDKLRP